MFFTVCWGLGSIAVGVTAAFIIYKYIIVWLKSKQNTSAVEMQSFIGGTAKVTERIPQGRYGKITYYANGNTYSAPAKSEDGNQIERNTEVTIVYIDKNTYYVKSSANILSKRLQ
ncbi:MAG: hypothetical protein LBQ68_09015 [Clostridiales bacterium]|jgi:membrane protein implicated in regulation of membrane protease activity|nr:hypothetical protein [Clostridiales bacterium]